MPGAQSSEDLAQAVEKVLQALAEHEPFFRDVRAGGGTVSLSVGWFFDGDTGEVFRHDLLRKLADLRIDLDLSFYACPPDRAAPEPSSSPE